MKVRTQSQGCGQRLMTGILVVFLVMVLLADQGCAISVQTDPAATGTAQGPTAPTTTTTSTSPLAPTTTVATAMQVTITQATTSTVSGYVVTQVDPATGQPLRSPIQATLYSLGVSAATSSTPIALASATVSTATTVPGAPLGTPAFTFPTT